MESLAKIEVEERDGVTVAHVSGEIDLDNAAQLQQAIVDAVSNGQPGLVIDLSKASYLDSAGIRLLFVLADRLTGRGQVLHAIVPADARIAQLLSIVNVERVAPCHPTTAAAIAALREPPGDRAHGPHDE